MITQPDTLDLTGAVAGTLLSTWQRIASNLLGQIDWRTDGKGYCRCPGYESHSNPTGKRDCTVFVGDNRAPSVFCVHTSCAGIIAERNRSLRSEIGKAKWAAEHGGDLPAAKKRPRLTEAERAKLDRRRHLENTRRQAAAALPGLLRRFAWPRGAMLQDSPIILGPESEHWRMLLGLYAPDDVLWIGDRKDSGRHYHKRFFRPVRRWLEGTLYPAGPLVAASTFKPDGFHRTREQVAASRFLVVESDTLNVNEIGAVLRYLRDAEGLRLRAVIDTAGRSIHGWFERPADPARLEELLFVLPALKCDPGPMREPCMSRLPSAWREGRQQRLLYFDGQS